MSRFSRRDFIIKTPAVVMAAAVSVELLHATENGQIDSVPSTKKGHEIRSMYPSTLDGIILRSPGGNLAISLGVDPVGRLSYSIAEGDIEVLDSSPLGLRVDGVDLGEGAKITGRAVVREIDEAYSIFGNHSQARNRAKEAVIPMKTSGKRFSLIVRAYDDGAAVRYILPEGARHIESDSTGWQLPEKTGRVVWSEYDPAYEGLSHATALAGIPQDRPVMAPITFEVEHHYLSISEADCESFSDMSIKRRGNLLQATFPLEPKGWDTQSTIVDARPNVLHGNYMGQLASPWRTTVVARDLTALVNSDLLTNLSPPPAQDMDFAWVKPGRALWSWWSVGNPPYDELETWYDAAAKLMWEYYLIDDGWIAWGRSGKDRWAMLKDISDYGKSVGVKTLVWGQYTEMPNPKARRAWLENAKAAGVEGVKLDFPPPASASCINWWYMGTLQDCAELRLLVNFHGSVKPTGMERTYPNSFTREAVRGDEYHMSRYKRIAPLEQDVTLPFARLLAGAGDITPVMMNPTELSTAGFTWPHEFAQAIVALSPVTAFADHYKYYLDSPLKDLFREIPTVWDETLVLSCTDIGQVVAYARRKDDSWWIGVMNGGKERNIEISLDFLDKPGHGTLVYDDASRDAAVERRERMVKSTDVLALKLRPAGGFVARITPQATRDSKPS